MNGIGKKGQASIEFLLLISISIVYLSTVVLPAVDVSRLAAEDVSQLAQTKMAAEKLCNAIDTIAAAGGEAKQTITIFVPARGTVHCENQMLGENSAKIRFSFLLTKTGQSAIMEHSLCATESSEGKSCEGSCQPATEFQCTTNATIGDPAKSAPITKKVSVTKESGGIVVNIP